MPLWQVKLNETNFCAHERCATAGRFLHDTLEAADERADPPMIYTGEIFQVAVRDSELPSSGYTFYPEEAET